MIAIKICDLDYREFNLNLVMVKDYIQGLNPTVTGLQGSYTLEVYSTEPISEESVQSIKDYWNALTSSSPEALAYFSKESLTAAIDAAKADAITKAYDALSAQQKKLLFNLSLSDSDNTAILTAFGV